jgi:hypothetical protein
MKNVVFWDVAPCRFYVNRRFGGTYRLHLQGRKIHERRTSVSRCLQTAFCTSIEIKNKDCIYHEHAACNHLLTLVPRSRIFLPEDGGDTFLRNVGSHKIYTAPHPRRRHSSYSPQWKPQILHSKLWTVKEVKVGGWGLIWGSRIIGLEDGRSMELFKNSVEWRVKLLGYTSRERGRYVPSQLVF